MSFSRTPSGLAAEYLLYKEILVYVEGYTDIPFYDAVLQNYNCRIKAKNGREECEKAATVLVDSNDPYVVILDGDYEILERTRSKHRRVILLHRYSFENYLFEEEPIEQFCHDHAHLADSLERLVDSKFGVLLEDTALKFKELLVLDVAHQYAKTGYKTLFHNSDKLFKTRKKVDFRDDEIQKRCTEATQRIDSQSIANAKILVEKFLEKHRFIDLLPGHFAFGIIRRLIIDTLNKKNRRNSNISDDNIRGSLSREVWRLVETDDHNSLKRRLRHAVREAQKMPRPGKGVQG